MNVPVKRRIGTVALSIAGVLALLQADEARAQSPASVPAPAPDQFEKKQSRSDILTLQVLLDRARHSPGVIDGIMGDNTRRAIMAYQRSTGLEPTGRFDPHLLDRLRRSDGGGIFQTYTVTKEDADGPFRNVPSTMTGKSELDRVAFESPAELLAEKFHMSRSFLERLNPDANFGKAGTKITVIKPGSDEHLRDVQRIEVDKSANELRAYTKEGSLVATYPTTVGSGIHPSPNETLQVVAVAPDPTYHFDPSGRSWGPDQDLTIAPGPNNPVGVVWIDLSRDGFGIHGTPEPKLIGKTSSHGCVRLTNWDAHELSLAVDKGTTVHFL